MPNQYQWQKGDISVPLSLEVQYNDVAVSGLSPTVEIRRFADDAYADFSTNTFVTSGGTRLGALSGISPNSVGLYRRSFDPVVFGETGNKTYFMLYRATIPSGFQGLESDQDVTATETHYFTELAGSGTTGVAGMAASFCE